jgi:tetratricopeptide (TPR) repeat protein
MFVQSPRFADADLAESYVEVNEFEKAFASYEKAAELYQTLRDGEPNALQRESSNVHKRLAEFAAVYKHDVPKAVKSAEIAMASYEPLIEKNEEDLDLMADAAEAAAFLGEMYYSTHEYQHALYHYAQSYRWYKTLHQKSSDRYKDSFAALLNNYALLAFTGKLGNPVQGCSFVDEGLALQPSEKIALSLRKLDDLCKRSG